MWVFCSAIHFETHPKGFATLSTLTVFCCRPFLLSISFLVLYYGSGQYLLHTFTVRFLLVLDICWYSRIPVRYSFPHRLQKWVSRSCICFPLLLNKPVTKVVFSWTLCFDQVPDSEELNEMHQSLTRNNQISHTYSPRNKGNIYQKHFFRLLQIPQDQLALRTLNFHVILSGGYKFLKP